jgi:hypothetical protein
MILNQPQPVALERPVFAFRVIVWHGNIAPNHRDSTTLSDGAIFRNPADVARYQHDVERAGGKVFCVRKIDNPRFCYDSLDEFYRIGSMSLAELEHVRTRYDTQFTDE